MRHRADRPLHFCAFWLRVGYWRLGNALCWFAFQCAALFRATVLAHEKWPIRASLRPLDIYIYAFGSQSCATRLIFVGSARLTAQNKAARGTSGRVRRVESTLGFATVPRGNAPASFARHPRRDAASPEYRLLASLAPVGAIREPHPRVSLRSALDHSPRFLITC